jgi:DNA primase small subunit
MNSEEFVQRLFSDYYRSHQPAPNSLEKREFGFGGFEKKIEARHAWFKSQEALSKFLIVNTPFYLSYSAAYYEFPDARPMPKKNWLGADLIFDLDAPAHECGKFTCQICLEKIKAETLKLIENFLIPDFGFAKPDFAINFSGNRGYHLHIRHQSILELSREERRELVDYITGTGIEFASFFRTDENNRIYGPLPTDGGYYGKLARETISQLQDGKGEIVQILGKKFEKPPNAQKLIDGIRLGNWDAVRIIDKEKKFNEILKTLTIKLSDQVDANVTADTSKLIRVPNSLHGGSGLCAIDVKKGISDFNPLSDAVVLPATEVKVEISEPVPKIEMKNQTFGPYGKDAQITVPAYFAAYLICKRAAAIG